MYESIDNESSLRSYTAYGDGDASATRARMAYAGELAEEGMGWYLLGERPYAPMQRRFLAPDRTSPFDGGGWNRYAYCAGDPVNRIDPDGKEWTRWAGIAIGLIGSIRTARNTVNAFRKHVKATQYSGTEGLSGSVGFAAMLRSPSAAYVAANATLAVLATGFTIGSIVAAASGHTSLALALGLGSGLAGVLANPPMPKNARQWVKNRLGIDPLKPEGTPAAEGRRYTMDPRSPSPWPDGEGRRPGVTLTRFGRRDSEDLYELDVRTRNAPQIDRRASSSARASAQEAWADERPTPEHLYRLPGGGPLVSQGEASRAGSASAPTPRVAFGTFEDPALAALHVRNPSASRV